MATKRKIKVQQTCEGTNREINIVQNERERVHLASSPSKTDGCAFAC